ncbi:MAG: mannitol dehydrogenase family protein, partial [Flavobacteriaceae bacterium]
MSLESRLTCPTYERSAVKTAIVHIGVGGFHRSHQAYYIHQLLKDSQYSDWGICGISLREGDR